MKTNLALVFAAAVSLSSIAHADDFEFRRERRHCDRREREERHEYEEQNYRPDNQSNGRYELRTTQVWVPGVQQQVWVPERCYGRGNWGRTCTPGYYRTVETAGHYENQQQWVWVAFQNQNSYGAYRPAARIDAANFNVNFELPQWSADFNFGPL
jgi:hypothetical protein